mgnify:CR=1 FL=1
MQHAAAQSLSVGQQDDHRCQSPYDAQHRQRRSQAVPHQRLPALRDEFFEEHGYLLTVMSVRDLISGFALHSLRIFSTRSAVRGFFNPELQSPPRNPAEIAEEVHLIRTFAF